MWAACPFHASPISVFPTVLRPPTGVLPSWMDPDVFLRGPAVSPWLLLIVCLFLFIETGLPVGLFLPADSLLFTAGLLVATGTVNLNFAVLAAMQEACTATPSRSSAPNCPFIRTTNQRQHTRPSLRTISTARAPPVLRPLPY